MNQYLAIGISQDTYCKQLDSKQRLVHNMKT
jgi:hypothetical protein